MAWFIAARRVQHRVPQTDLAAPSEILGMKVNPARCARRSRRNPAPISPKTNKTFNTTFAKIRVPVEWGIAHTKNWRILATRYRSDLARIDTDVQAVIGLEKLNEQHSGRPPTFQRIKNAVSEWLLSVESSEAVGPWPVRKANTPPASSGRPACGWASPCRWAGRDRRCFRGLRVELMFRFSFRAPQGERCSSRT